MAIVYSLNTLTERIRRHIANGFPNASFSATDNEVKLHINDALAFALVGQVFALAKIDGNISTPEGFLTTYSLPALQQDPITREWFTTLPQPPLSLPLGYSLDNAYFANAESGRSDQIHLIKAKRVARRKNMPLQAGANGWVEGSKFIVEANNGDSLLGLPVYVIMAGTRVTDGDAPLNVPDDILDAVFTKVTNKLIQRFQFPKDIIKDDIGAGNKTS